MKKVLSIFCFFIFFVNCVKVKDGYQDKISYLPSENIDVFLRGSSNGEVSIDLMDINENKIDQIKIDVFSQPEVDPNSWYEIGYQYRKTFSYYPSQLKSGIYYFENSSPFIIKNPKKKNDVLVIYPSNTDNAYNKNGGRSSYTKPKGNSLSFKRPFSIQGFAYNFLKWIPNQGFDVDYICDEDMDEYENILDYKVIIIPGHSEYWTRKARRNFDRFISQGGHAIILSGNTMWWQVRYKNDKMICFKQKEKDSLVPDTLRTTAWILPLLDYPILNSIGADFKHGGFGLNKDNGWDGYKIVNNSPLFDGTDISIGYILSIPSSEYDGIPLLFKNEIALIDTSKVNFYKQSLLGFDKGFREKIGETYGTFIVFQRTKESGIIINTGSTNWCSDGFSGIDGEKIKKLTYNFIDFLLKDKSVF